MTDLQDDTEAQPEPATAARPWWRRRPAQITAAILVIAAGAGIWTATRSSAPATTPAAATPTTTIAGTVVVLTPYFLDETTGSSTATMTANDACTGSGPYAGVTASLTVAVTGTNGKSLAEIPLAPGIVNNDPATGIAACIFDFNSTVPENAGTYTVTVGSYASKTYTESQLGSIAIGLQD